MLPVVSPGYCVSRSLCVCVVVGVGWLPVQDLHHARQVREMARQQANMMMAGPGLGHRSKSAGVLAVRPPPGGHFVGDTTDFLYRAPPPLPPTVKEPAPVDAFRIEAEGGDSSAPATAFAAIRPGAVALPL
jgi:hypothetical protein